MVVTKDQPHGPGHGTAYQCSLVECEDHSAMFWMDVNPAGDKSKLFTDVQFLPWQLASLIILFILRGPLGCVYKADR